MYRVRLRGKLLEEELANFYSVPHNHTKWEDHIFRVRKTIEFANKNFPMIFEHLWTIPEDLWIRIADLSCGDAAIAYGIEYDSPEYHLGDYAPGYEFTGPIEQTIWQIPEVDLFICCETIEHLDSPEYILSAIKHKSKYLLLSTPNRDCWDENPEHLWAWDTEAIQELLSTTGWVVIDFDLIIPEISYQYQVWWCKRA